MASRSFRRRSPLGACLNNPRSFPDHRQDQLPPPPPRYLRYLTQCRQGPARVRRKVRAGLWEPHLLHTLGHHRHRGRPGRPKRATPNSRPHPHRYSFTGLFRRAGCREVDAGDPSSCGLAVCRRHWSVRGKRSPLFVSSCTAHPHRLERRFPLRITKTLDSAMSICMPLYVLMLVCPRC